MTIIDSRSMPMRRTLRGDLAQCADRTLCRSSATKPPCGTLAGRRSPAPCGINLVIRISLAYSDLGLG